MSATSKLPKISRWPIVFAATSALLLAASAGFVSFEGSEPAHEPHAEVAPIEIGEGLPPEIGQGPIEQRRPSLRIGFVLGSRQFRLETMGVDPARRDGKAVPVTIALDGVAAEHPAQAGDVLLNALASRRRES